MSKYKYEYKDLVAEGYEHFTITRKQQNEIFKYRKWHWSTKYEYYVKDKTIIMQAIPNLLGCTVSTLLLPLGIILEGLTNAKETYKSMVTRTWQAKRYGAFSSDAIYKRKGDDDTFDKLITCKEGK